MSPFKYRNLIVLALVLLSLLAGCQPKEAVVQKATEETSATERGKHTEGEGI